MTTPKRSGKLVQALSGQDDRAQPLHLRTGIVRSFNKATSPWTVTITLGTIDIAGVNCLGWWDCEAGATVQVLQQGPQLLVIGPISPAKVYVPASPPPPPPPPPVLPPPPPAISDRTVGITAEGSAGWVFSSNSWRTDRFIQGGGSGGIFRPFWFYGGQIASAKGSGTIIGGSIFIRRTGSGGVYGGANVRLGTHGLTSAGAGSGGGSHGNVDVVGQLNKEQGGTFALTGAHIAALNAGAAGFGLEPGAISYVSPDYMPAYGRDAGEWSGQLSLTIRG